MATEINLLGLEVNPTVKQGNRIEIEFTVRDATSTPLDITGFDIRAQFRTSYASTQAVINCTLANNKLVKTDAANGKFVLRLQPADTSYSGNPLVKFTSDSPDTLALYYDIEVDDTAGANNYGVQAPFWGTLTLKREITR